MSGSASDPFFWNDWQGDPLLRLCSMAAQGFWMRCLCIAAESKRKGYVLVNGQKPTVEDFALIVGQPVHEVEIWLDELGHRGVYSVDRGGIIYSRRMIRAEKKRAASAKGGKIGGAVTRDEHKGIHGTRGVTRKPDFETTRHPRRAPLPSPSPFPNLEEGTTDTLRETLGLKHSSAGADGAVRKLKPQKGDPEGFLEWYEIYPRKEARGAAVRAYATARKKVDAATLLEAVRDYAAKRQGDDPRYTKMPSTWLNGECWRDEDASVAAANGDLLVTKARAHEERILWLKEYTRDGRWQKNISGNGIWVDSLDVGAPPHDPRTKVTADDFKLVPGSWEKRCEMLAKKAREGVSP